MPFALNRRALLCVISAPSGGGKSAVLQEILTRVPDLHYSISYTSRPPRGDEVDGKDFHFVSRLKFEEMIAAGAFYEHAEVHGNLYGTSAEVVETMLGERRDVAMDLDVQGGLNVKKRLPDSVLIFLMPPSMEVLEQRLRGRETDDEEQICLRMENAKREIEHWNQYDYIVMNEELERTVEEVERIIEAERRRASRSELKRNGR